jgi:phenylpyruvate tautomerase PptA (4-oxalocrotonate tautomerase family)
MIYIRSSASLRKGEFDNKSGNHSNLHMPTFILHTSSVINDHQNQNIRKDTVDILSQELGKSKEFIVTLIHDSVAIEFGQSEGPCAYVEVKSVGTLSPEQTTAMSDRICNTLQRILSIPPDRIYIEFQESPRHLWGWNGKTFAK